MKFELVLYINEMSQKTEKMVVEGSSFSIVDSSTGPLFVVIGARSTPVYVCDKSRLHSMKLLKDVKERTTLHALDGRAEKETTRRR